MRRRRALELELDARKGRTPPTDNGLSSLNNHHTHTTLFHDQLVGVLPTATIPAADPDMYDERTAI